MHAWIATELRRRLQRLARRLLGRVSDRRLAIPPSPIIFVAGAQRSGTTLVQTLVANGLDAPVLPECHILCELALAYQSAKTEWLKTSAFYANKEELRAYFRNVVGRHVTDIATRCSAGRLVLKDPNFSMVLKELEELLPTAKTVICVRDPRDIAASFVRIGQRQVQQGEESRYTRRDIGFICKKLNASYESLLAGAAGNGCFLVKYEEVVSDPASVLAKLASETGLPLVLDRIDKPVWLDAARRHQATWITELEEKPPTPEHVGSFRNVLLHKEIEKVEELCRPLMQRLGYAASMHGPEAVNEEQGRANERKAKAAKAGFERKQAAERRPAKTAAGRSGA